MGERRGLFIITLIVMFILFLSWLSIVFNLEGGFFVFELVLLIVFLLAAVVLARSILVGKKNRKLLLVFYGSNLINLIIIYFATFRFKEIILPLIIIGIGFVLAARK